MNRKFISIVLVFLVFGSVLAYQATQQGTSVVLKPSEILSENAGKDLKRIRVAGRVTTEPVNYQVEPEIKLTFSIQDPGSDTESNSGVSIPVVYNSLKPDMFAAGRDVIIDGEFSGGKLIAYSLLTQCPSKYEPPSLTDNAGKDS
ncbi:MAG: cytochrome c maturation protein CcmE [Bdellovibrionales bacterium]|nr:cytochrome c maturation protein CcmE [Bdellovibrionales bacterium]